MLTVKQASLGEAVTSGIMFVEENLPHLCKHYTLLTQKVKGALPLELTGIFLPGEAEENEVGKDSLYPQGFI